MRRSALLAGRCVVGNLRQLLGAERVRTRDDGWDEITVPVADERELAPILLQLGPDAVVEEPPSLRDQIVARLAGRLLA